MSYRTTYCHVLGVRGYRWGFGLLDLLKVHFASKGHRSQPPTVIAVHVLTERNISLLFSGELHNGHCDALLPVEEKKRGQAFSTQFSFQRKPRPEICPVGSSSSST
jgi:hypothetical protein